MICIKAEPKNLKFADKLTHRDYLGALMSLGMKRECIGDILVDDTHAFIFCTDAMAGMICEELTEVKHTVLKCSIVDEKDIDIEQKFIDMKVNVASERLDALIAAVFKMSRTAAVSLINTEKVRVNEIICQSPDKKMNENDSISVRGHGKFKYCGVDNLSRKGRLFVDIKMYA